MMRGRTRRLLIAPALFLGLSCWAVGALAQTPYPSKPIRIIVPFTPGGGVDLLARIVGGKLTEAWGQPTVIDHRPGGSATLGPALAAKSPPDGYTLVLVTTGFTMTPGLQKVPYDPVADFTPLTLIAVVPNILVVHPSLPAKSLKDLVALSRSEPLTYASSGYAAVGHLVMEMLRITVPRLQLVHVPYKAPQHFTECLTCDGDRPCALPSAMPQSRRYGSADCHHYGKALAAYRKCRPAIGCAGSICSAFVLLIPLERRARSLPAHAESRGVKNPDVLES